MRTYFSLGSEREKKREKLATGKLINNQKDGLWWEQRKWQLSKGLRQNGILENYPPGNPNSADPKLAI